MSQLITRDNQILCQTKVDYPPDTVKDMKSFGIKVKQVAKLPYEESDEFKFPTGDVQDGYI